MNINKQDLENLLKLATSTKKSYFGGKGRKKVFEFLNNLRDSGIINMFQATDILWSGSVWLRKYLDLHHPRLLQAAEDEYYEYADKSDLLRIPNIKYLLDNADEIRQIIISTAMFNVEEKMGSAGIKDVDRHVRPAAQDFVKLWMQLAR